MHKYITGSIYVYLHLFPAWKTLTGLNTSHPVTIRYTCIRDIGSFHGQSVEWFSGSIIVHVHITHNVWANLFLSTIQHLNWMVKLILCSQVNVRRCGHIFKMLIEVLFLGSPRLSTSLAVRTRLHKISSWVYTSKLILQAKKKAEVEEQIFFPFTYIIWYIPSYHHVEKQANSQIIWHSYSTSLLQIWSMHSSGHGL